MMTLDDAAQQLNVSVEYVSKLLADGKLPSLSTEHVTEYKRQQDDESAAALDELARQDKSWTWINSKSPNWIAADDKLAEA